MNMEENPDYLTTQIITYLGNKRALLGTISKVIDNICLRENRKKLILFDGFSGSGVVARLFKRYAESLIVNDLEDYSGIINSCYLTNPSPNVRKILEEFYRERIESIQEDDLQPGWIAELYAPQNDDSIQEGERVFFTRRNACYIDTVRPRINELEESLRPYLLAPLLSEVSIHTNTSGVFKGFYKDTFTGIGQFGGNRRAALSRILKDIHIPFPIFSRYNCPAEIYSRDINDLIPELKPLDVAYLDPPYNQHPYGSNYFMLNLVARYQRPEQISRISGIPVDWKRSNYNYPQRSIKAFTRLVREIKTKYLLVSFNSEGFISKEEMFGIFKSIGKVDITEIPYNTFRGSRNLHARNIHVKEYLYLVEKTGSRA